MKKYNGKHMPQAVDLANENCQNFMFRAKLKRGFWSPKVLDRAQHCLRTWGCTYGESWRKTSNLSNETAIRIGSQPLSIPFRIGQHFQELNASSGTEGQIACIGLGSRWPPNGRQLGPLHVHLPQTGIYRCQRSQATRAATSPPQPPTVDTRKKVDWWNWLLRWFWFSLLYSSDFHSLIGYYLNVFGGLWKIGLWMWMRGLSWSSRNGRRLTSAEGNGSAQTPPSPAVNEGYDGVETCFQLLNYSRRFHIYDTTTTQDVWIRRDFVWDRLEVWKLKRRRVWANGLVWRRCFGNT